MHFRENHQIPLTDEDRLKLSLMIIGNVLTTAERPRAEFLCGPESRSADSPRTISFRDNGRFDGKSERRPKDGNLAAN